MYGNDNYALLPFDTLLPLSVSRVLKNTDFILDVRGKMEIKGKGLMTTYFLNGRGSRLLAGDEDGNEEKNGTKPAIKNGTSTEEKKAILRSQLCVAL